MDDKPQPHTNGSLNGSNGSSGVNAHAATIAPRRSIPSKRRRAFLSWSFSAIARLLTWYSIFTIFFRCPPSLDACNESSPTICEPYFRVKLAVAPHVGPYYDAYAAPYLNLARPYYDTFDRKVITPGRAQAVKYGGPRLAQVQAYGRAQWERNVQPQILEYQALAKAQYDHAISPYVDKAATTIAPYYDVARTNALQTYHELLVPTYTFVHPYATRSYDAAYGLTKHTIIPSTVWVWNKTYAFIDSAVWPHLRDIYILKVEPQLIRIGERLGRYRDKRTKPAVEETEPILHRSTFVKPTSSVSSTGVSATKEPTHVASQEANVDGRRGPEAVPDSRSGPNAAPKTKEEIRELAAQAVAEDLDLWESKFSHVAEEGASELEDRVEEISTRMVENHAHVTGRSLVLQLKTTIHTEIESLKKTIVDILEKTQNNSEKRDEKLAAAVRGAGLNIRNKAQEVRDWRQSYEQKTEIAITKAAEEHFTILQRTRDLALQKIGMKWAWMDGVTYKDWQKYHQLKDRFEEWVEGLKRLITTHPALTRAQTAGADIEDEGMAIAHEAAIELGRLKQVAAWKATAEDLSDDFDSSTMRLAAKAAEERIAAAAEAARLAEATLEQSMNDTDTTDEARPKTADSTEDSSVSESETESGSDQEAVDTPPLFPMESLTPEPTSRASNINSEYSSTSNPQTSNASGDSMSIAEPVTSLPDPNPTDGSEQMVEPAMESLDSSVRSVDEEATSTTVKSALFGVAAESAPTRQLVLDDYGLAPESMVSYVVQSAGLASSAPISGEQSLAQEENRNLVSNTYSSAMAAANPQLNPAIQESSSADELAASASPTVQQYIAVSSLISELMIGKEPSYTSSVYSRLAQAYRSDIPSPSSSSSVLSATAAGFNGMTHDAANPAPEATNGSATSTMHNTNESAVEPNDEL